MGVTMESAPVGPVPVQKMCPSCGNSIVSRIEHKSSAKTHLIAVILFVSVCLPCAFVPYCMDSCKNVDHYCPNCNAYLGTYQH
ncbi:PREDICTED: lipopolysaccharide-induced tumor necrosis factor-alpha factor homolog [Papilio xuthus]|uniref:Lipopolysaccharide-induced tumor necrosis factor-alpha factor homolog n=1 Tax=Papilio xuthus TaxID=66420 RepID=A0AAJ6YYI1_PAPXU|nr:PREDICTED: lipopolysaccharide-induced tumor necrosis factor-alpha factor homolog [Papilio xuthus]